MIWHFCHTILVPVRCSPVRIGTSPHTWMIWHFWKFIVCPESESEAKSHSECSIWHCRVAFRALTFHTHAIGPLSTLRCHISFYKIIFSQFFLSVFLSLSSARKKWIFSLLLFGFTFHCLFKYSFNLVNVLASGVCARDVRVEYVFTQPRRQRRRHRCLRSHSTPSKRTYTHAHAYRHGKRWREMKKWPKIFTFTNWRNSLRFGVIEWFVRECLSSQSYHIFAPSFRIQYLLLLAQLM